MNTNSLALAALLLLSPISFSQEFIPLAEVDMARLGIVFAPLSSPDRQSGNRFPATVVSSPEQVADIVVPFRGAIVRWHVAPGATVGSDQVLADIHSQEVHQLQKNWLTAWSAVSQAEHEAERDQLLFDKGIIAQRRLAESEHILQQARFELNGFTGILAQAGFDRQSLEELVDRPERMGIYALRSPGHGVLTARHYSVGQHMEKYQVAGSLGTGGQPWLQANIPVRYAGSIDPGRSLGIDGSPASAIVKYRELIVNEASQTITLLAEFNSPVDFIPGMILNLVLPVDENKILVPGDAVVHNGDNTVVYLRTADGVEARTVRLEPAGSNYIAGEELRVGDQVVIQGAAILKGIQLGLGQDE